LTHILAIDPGLRATGYAYFRNGTLARCGLKRCDLIDRAEIAAAIGREFAVEFLKPLDALVVEVPQIYQPRFMKGDPNDLVNLALVAGSALQLPAKIRRAISPHQWKGNVPKEITRSRVLFALSDMEREILLDANVPESLKHNVFDAVGIGQWFLAQKMPTPIALTRRKR
jgi:hypothetical protein